MRYFETRSDRHRRRRLDRLSHPRAAETSQLPLDLAHAATISLTNSDSLLFLGRPPSVHGTACSVRWRIAGSRVAESLIVGFQLRNGAVLPFPGLRQEGAAMKRSEGRGLAVQRRDGAVSANVFHDGQAVHVRISPFLFPDTNLRHNDFRFVSGTGRENVWFPNC